MADQYVPGPGSNWGYAPLVFVETCVLYSKREATLRQLMGQEVLPDPDPLGDWRRWMGDPQMGQAGLGGLGQVRDTLTAWILR